MSVADIVKANLAAVEVTEHEQEIVLAALQRNLMEYDFVSMDGMYDDIVERLGDEVRGRFLFNVAIGA